MQYKDDSADHPLPSIDGLGTFHGMGNVAVITPGLTISRPVKTIHVTSEDIVTAGHINI